MKTAHEILSDNHWTLEEYTQRMTVAEWRAVLAAEADRPMVKGQLRRLIAKRLGFGYVDVSKETL
jgi:hypothetical protein